MWAIVTIQSSCGKIVAIKRVPVIRVLQYCEQLFFNQIIFIVEKMFYFIYYLLIMNIFQINTSRICDKIMYKIVIFLHKNNEF